VRRDERDFGDAGDLRHSGRGFPKQRRNGMEYERATPGHGASSRSYVAAVGGGRGCRQRSNVSMMIICPPQLGHGGCWSTGFSALDSSSSRTTPSSSRASVMLALREEPARSRTGRSRRRPSWKATMKTHPQLQRSVPGIYNARYGNDTGGVGLPINPNQSMRDNIRSQRRPVRTGRGGRPRGTAGRSPLPVRPCWRPRSGPG